MVKRYRHWDIPASDALVAHPSWNKWLQALLQNQQLLAEVEPLTGLPGQPFFCILLDTLVLALVAVCLSRHQTLPLHPILSIQQKVVTIIRGKTMSVHTIYCNHFNCGRYQGRIHMLLLDKTEITMSLEETWSSYKRDPQVVSICVSCSLGRFDIVKAMFSARDDCFGKKSYTFNVDKRHPPS